MPATPATDHGNTLVYQLGGFCGDVFRADYFEYDSKNSQILI